MQSEILQFVLCHLFREFPADLVPPWLLSGNTYAKTFIRATYCDSCSRPDRWSNLFDDRTAMSSECTHPDCIQTLFRCTVSILFLIQHSLLIIFYIIIFLDIIDTQSNFSNKNF